jgi:hypothetical protein
MYMCSSVMGQVMMRQVFRLYLLDWLLAGPTTSQAAPLVFSPTVCLSHRTLAVPLRLPFALHYTIHQLSVLEIVFLLALQW